MLYLIYFIVAFLPLYLITVSIFSVPFTVLELTIYALFLVWIFKKEEAISFKELPVVPITLIFFGGVISTLFSQNIIVGLGILKGWFFAPLLFLFVLSQVVKTQEQIKNIFSALALGGFGIAAIALYYFLSGDLTFDGRLKAFYLSPNHLAMALAPSLLVMFWFFLSAGRAKERMIWFAFFIPVFSAFYLTYSYGAWAAVFFGVVSLTLLSPLPKIKKAATFAFLIAAFFVLAFSQASGEKFVNIFDERGSLASRTMIWRAAVEMIKTHPIVGIGPGMFQREYLALQPQFPPYLEWAVPQPHNLFLAFWLQTGIAGLAGFFWLLIAFFRRGVEVIKKTPLKDDLLTGHGREIAVLCLALMFYILIHGLVDTPYWKNDLAVMFWLIVGLFYISYTVENGNKSG